MTTGADWRGRVGSVWADAWMRTDRAFAEIGVLLNEAAAALAPPLGRAVDIGCGAGSSALALAAARPGLEVVGVDLSPDLVAVARSRSRGVRFEAGDATAVAARLAPVSLMLSRHGVMFFDDPVAAFGRLAAACDPGAPFVFTCFRARRDNGWAALIDDAVGAASRPQNDTAPGPFAFADAARTRAILRDAGWTGIDIRPHDVRYVMGAAADPAADPVADALAFARRIGPAASVLAAADPARRRAIEDRLADRFAARLAGGTVAAGAAIWLCTARKDPAR